MKIIKKIRKKRRKLIRRFFKSPIKKRLGSVFRKRTHVFESAGRKSCIPSGEFIIGGGGLA